MRPITLFSLLLPYLAAAQSTTQTGSYGAAPSGGFDGSAPGGGGSGGQSSSTAMYLVGKYTVDNQTVTNSSQTITTSTADENVVLVTNGGNLTLQNSVVKKTGGDTDSGDNSNFYGLNAAICVQNSSVVYLENVEVYSNAEGSNAVFSTGTGSVAYVKNVNITTESNSSRGLDSTQKGTIYAENIIISTKGQHCAGLANDRGEGVTVANNVHITTAGNGSPGIYCTGNITATNVESVSTAAQCIVVEGFNNVTLTDGVMVGYDQAAVMLYQSASGDASNGDAIFSMTRGSLFINTTAELATSTSRTASGGTVNTTTSNANGSYIYITNQKAYVYLYDHAVIAGTSGVLAKCSTDSWGTSGSNGGNLFLEANAVDLAGELLADNISTISVTFSNSSTFIGSIPIYGGKTGVSLDDTSKWTLTANSYLWNFTDADTTFANVVDNGFSIYYNTSSSVNSWLDGNTVALAGGGNVAPWTA